MSRINHGTVELRLGDEVYVLHNTPAVLLALSDHFGSYRDIVARCEAMDVRALVNIVAIGANIKRERHDAIAAAIQTAGLFEAVRQLSDYLWALADPTGRAREGEADEANETGKA